MKNRLPRRIRDRARAGIGRLSGTAAVSSALAVAGCAAIFSSGPTALTFQSNPAGAQILVNGVPRGTTPLVLELHADDAQIVTFRREGCTDVTLPLETHVQAGFVILDILAGIIGIAVDAGTGEWKEFNERTPYAQLDCTGAPGRGIPDPPMRAGLPPAPDSASASVDTAARPVRTVEVPPSGVGSFPAGRWAGSLSSPAGSPFQAAITLNEVGPSRPGGAVAGLATYTRASTACVYRLTVLASDGDRLELDQSIESASASCARGLILTLEEVSDGSLAVSLRQRDGRVWATGLIRPAGCEMIEGAWRPANCP